MTLTAAVHAAARKQTFDDLLRAAHSGEESAPFDLVSDYVEYVDGKAHMEGTRPFLAPRRITLSEGRPENPPTREMIHGPSTPKDEGIRGSYAPGSSHSKFGALSGGVARCQAAARGGVVEQELRRAPDTFLCAARVLGVKPDAHAVDSVTQDLASLGPT